MRKNVWKTWKKSVLSLAVTMLVTAGLAVTAKAGGASFGAAQPLQMGQRQQLSFQTSGDAQYYSFTTDSVAGWYSINFGKSGGERVYLDVYATPDKSKPILTDWSLYGDGNITKVLSLSPNTKYYIMVVPKGNKVGATANFVVTKINDDYGNDLASGRVLSLGGTIAGNIEVSDMDESDTFRFTTTGNNSYYEVSLSSTASNGVYSNIYRGPDTSYDRTEIYAGGGSTNTVIYQLERNRTYYVRITGRSNDQTSYKFVVKEIKDDAGNDFADATKMSNGKTLAKTIQDDKLDTDFFKFKTSKKQTYYQLTFKNKSKNSMRVTIYNNNDIASAINEVNNLYVDGASTKTIWLKLKKNRTHYVKVTGGDNCSYNIQLNDVKSIVKKTAPSSFKAKGYSGWFSKYASLTWKHKCENANYEIYRSTSPNSGFKKIKTVKNTASYTDQKVKRGATYYYKIRYVVKENGKICKTKWSKVKKVKIK